MDAERARSFLLSLPDVVETEQWGGLVFWVGDKAVDGKMFARLALEQEGRVASFAAGAEHYNELLEQEGIFPAPYMARIYWVAVERWSVLRDGEWREEFAAAYERTRAKMPPKMQRFFALSKAEQKKAISAARRKK